MRLIAVLLLMVTLNIAPWSTRPAYADLKDSYFVATPAPTDEVIVEVLDGQATDPHVYVKFGAYVKTNRYKRERDYFTQNPDVKFIGPILNGIGESFKFDTYVTTRIQEDVLTRYDSCQTYKVQNRSEWFRTNVPMRALRLREYVESSLVNREITSDNYFSIGNRIVSILCGDVQSTEE